ncbi:MAG: hypothetical protein CM1200mP2_59500 [Planctomycetaceae bacterium]|nr:MAG: hypothetical protein CM1200mP2_59500 [Planctomycetaceae bacterium]
MKWVRKKMTLVAVVGIPFGGGLLQAGAADAAGKKKNGPVRVVVWDERQPRPEAGLPRASWATRSPRPFRFVQG